MRARIAVGVSLVAAAILVAVCWAPAPGWPAVIPGALFALFVVGKWIVSPVPR